MACFGGVIKVCTNEGGQPVTLPNQNSNGQNNNQNNGVNNNPQNPGSVDQPNNGGSAIVNLPQGDNNSTSTNTGQGTANGGVIVQINNGTAIINYGTINYYYIVTNNGSTTAPTAAESSNIPRTNGKIDLRTFLRNQLTLLGAVRGSENPVQFALAKINSDKAFVEAFVQALREKFDRVRIYERKSEAQNLYQYSVKATGNGLKVKQWLSVENDRAKYGLQLKTENLKFREWIDVNATEGRVNYNLNLRVGNIKISETFNGTKADYTYSLEFTRDRKRVQNFEGITLGSAKVEGNRYILTPNAYAQRGAVWSNEKLDLTKDFTVKANLYLGDRVRGADGIAFVIQNSPQGRDAIGMAGGGLGYRGIENSFAVEFDTWKNPGEINGNHIGFDLNGEGRREVPTSERVFPLPQPLESGREIPVTINWNYLGDNRARVSVNIFGKTYSYVIEDIVKLFGGTKAYIGFTGATGGERNLQYVSNVKVIAETEEKGGRLNGGSFAWSLNIPQSLQLRFP